MKQIEVFFIVQIVPFIFYMQILLIESFQKNLPTDPKYCLVIVDLFSSKASIYPMRSRKPLPNKEEAFYKEIANERKKGEKIRMQTGLNFKQNIIYEIKTKVQRISTFSTAVRGGKTDCSWTKNQETKKEDILFHIFKKN